MIDLVAIAPFYIELFIRAIVPDLDSDSRSLDGLSIIRVLRLSRVLRVFKVSRSFTGIIILMRTLAKSVSAIAMCARLAWRPQTPRPLTPFSMAWPAHKRASPPVLAPPRRLLFFVLLCVVVFSALIFYAEQGVYHESCNCFLREDGSQSPFESIIGAAWFCIVTMTTVGYGDVTPVSTGGRVIATACMVCGLIVISLPITIIGANFDMEYKLMEVDKRNRLLRELNRRKGVSPGVTLALVEQTVDAHKKKLTSMLQDFESTLDDHAAQLDALVKDLKQQLVVQGVSVSTGLEVSSKIDGARRNSKAFLVGLSGFPKQNAQIGPPASAGARQE